MGFGTLFVGYFLLLNFAYYDLTDAIAAAVMLYAFYKLKNINEGFKNGVIAASVFTVFGLLELILSVLGTVLPSFDLSPILWLRPILRHGIICITTFFMLGGMREVADEVGLPFIASRCKRNFYITGCVYILNVFSEIAGLSSIFEPRLLAFIYLYVTLATIGVICLNLISIYSCHVRICMPDDDLDKVKESRFGFINEMRRHKEEKEREYAEYKLEKLKSKKKKRKK